MPRSSSKKVTLYVSLLLSSLFRKNLESAIKEFQKDSFETHILHSEYQIEYQNQLHYPINYKFSFHLKCQSYLSAQGMEVPKNYSGNF